MRDTADILDDLLAGIRETVEPLLHLDDKALAASDISPPMVRLHLNLRRILREYEAAEAEAEGGA